MLNIFSRKLCPLLSLALATMGCGKKIAEDGPAKPKVVESQELPSALVIKLTADENKETYQVPRNANIFLPDALWVRGGDPSGKTVTISYNLKDGGDDTFDYKCTYTATSATKMNLQSCVNNFGEAFEDVSRFDFPINYGRYIKMELQGGLGLAVDAVYTADWI